MSLTGLATAAGLSKATLSGLERSGANPSIDTVWALAQALGVQFAALLEDDGNDVLHVRKLRDALVVSSERGFVGRHLLSRSRRGPIELYVLDLEAGADRHAAPHSPGVLEHVIVLSGTVAVGPNEAPMTLEPDDCMTFSADRPHIYQALDGPARLLSITDYP
jgi:transcriptional regulator with XRE-family HTH domain